MGCLVSKEEKTANERSRQIDNDLKREAYNEARSVKILLLGAGESGKSTFIKQMKFLYLRGYNREECETFKSVVHNNAIQSLVVILKAMGTMNISFQDSDRKADMETFLCKVGSSEDLEITPDLALVMSRLWIDNRLQECFNQAKNYQLNDSAEYFLSALERISVPDYIPLDQDILRTRVKTTGINEITFNYRGLAFRVYDIGGQRSERKKWIHCFEDVTCLIFMVAMSAYDLNLIEDNNTNRLHESLKLFDSISNNQWFTKTSIVLFLNKRDLFLSKIKQSPLSIAFPEYTGKNNFDECSVYMQGKFERLIKKESKKVYTHFTCATDTGSIRFLFLSVTDTIWSENLKDCGIL